MYIYTHISGAYGSGRMSQRRRYPPRDYRTVTSARRESPAPARGLRATERRIIILIRRRRRRRIIMLTITITINSRRSQAFPLPVACMRVLSCLAGVFKFVRTTARMLVFGWTDGQTDRWTVGRTDGRTVGRTDGRTPGRTDGRIDCLLDRLSLTLSDYF